MSTPDLAAVAATTQRLAVLLAAGNPPAAAWRHLADEPFAAEVSKLVDSGDPLPGSIARVAATHPGRLGQLWATLGTAWTVASQAGAPLAPTLDELAGSIRDLVQTQREIAVALASPTATARLVLVLPAIGLACGTVLGFNTIGVLVTTPVGWGCLAVGGALLFGASRWNRRMVRAAQPPDDVPGIQLDLLAIALAGGGSVDSARATVDEAIEQFLGVPASEPPEISSVLNLSKRAGVPAAALLRSEASELRREARTRAAEAAQALSVRLLLPLGLCVLPAFMVLTVVPLVLAVLSETSFAR